MNAFSFVGLIAEIFFKSRPDLKKIERKGLLAVKIGQMFALRADFLRPETCTHLSRLYRNVSAIPSEDFERLLDRSVDADWRGHFAEIDPKPLATASVAQVHRARLKTGEAVVIKVLKADFAQRLQRDVKRIHFFFRILLFLYPKLRRVANPLALLAMIRDDTLAELDLRNEIKHQGVLRDVQHAYGRRVNLSALGFPKIYPELSNENVLVMEEIRGRTFQELLEAGELEYEELLRLFHLHGFYIFAMGTFHGDIHPGNIILSDDRVYLVDCGALARVCVRLREGLFHFMKHLAYSEFSECAEALHSMSEARIDEKRFERFREKLLDLYRDFPGKTVSQASLTRQMMHTIQLAVHHGMDFGEGLFSIIKSLMYLDGMVIRCKPEAVLMEDMRRNVAELEPFMTAKALAGYADPPTPEAQPPVFPD